MVFFLSFHCSLHYLCTLFEKQSSKRRKNKSAKKTPPLLDITWFGCNIYANTASKLSQNAGA